MDRFPVVAVYNFTSVGYVVAREELQQFDCPGIVKDLVVEVMQRIVNGECRFCVSMDSLLDFSAGSGQVVVPLVGKLYYPPGSRDAYMKRYSVHIDENGPHRIKVLDKEMPRLAVFCAEDMSVVYMHNPRNNAEKIHIFRTELVSRIMEANTVDRLNFGVENWDNFVKDISKMHR